MSALVQLLPHHRRLRPAKGGSAPSSPCPWLPDRPAFRRITSLCLRSGPQSGSPLDQAHPLRGGRDFYARAFSPAGHPTAKSGITTAAVWTLAAAGLAPAGRVLLWAATLLGQARTQRHGSRSASSGALAPWGRGRTLTVSSRRSAGFTLPTTLPMCQRLLGAAGDRRASSLGRSPRRPPRQAVSQNPPRRGSLASCALRIPARETRRSALDASRPPSGQP